TMYDPRRHREASTRRRNIVLTVMRDHSVIDEADYLAAVANPIRLGKAPILRRAPYFTDFVIAALANVPGVGTNLAGLEVFTTLDAEIQDTTADAVRANADRLEKGYRGLRRTAKADKLQSSAVVLDAKTGAIRALIGGRSYAESQFNRATSALRQPGSAFKPVVYLSAIEAGVAAPGMLVTDAPVSINGWSPQNFTGRYLGDIPLETAFAQSIN